MDNKGFASKYGEIFFKLTNKKILLLILVLATALRFWHFFQIPITHDEFSALFRLRFDNFYDLIEKGVKVDAHPAGVQVFLFYWGKIFGYSATTLKLPFLIFGILAVYLSYLLGKIWYNETVGLIIASIICCLEYTVTYSQIFRPYGSGFLFALAMVYYFTKLIQMPERHFFRNGILFVLFGTLCAYDHYFALLFTAIVGISGLFLIQKKYRFRYFILCCCIFLLFSPYLPIFFVQLSYGGVEQWLAKPTPDFLPNYIYYLFNFSFLFISLIIAFVIWPFLTKNYKIVNKKKYLLFGTWFLLPLLIGYFYSVYINAVLQYSVLIFSFIFLLYILFGHFKNLPPLYNLTLCSLILFFGIFSLTYTRKYYTHFYKSIYPEILKDFNTSQSKYANILGLIHSNKAINNFYIKKMKIDASSYYSITNNNIKNLKFFLKSNAAKHNVAYYGSISNSNPLILPILESYYPHLIKQSNYWGGTSYILSKGKSNLPTITQLNFDKKQSKDWDYSKDEITDSVAYKASKTYRISKKEVFGPGYTAKIQNLSRFKEQNLVVSLAASGIDTTTDAVLVATIQNGQNTIFWSGEELKKQSIVSKKEWDRYFLSIPLNKSFFKNKNNLLKVYIWNSGKEEFFIDDFSIKIEKGNPIIYGIVSP